MNSTLARSFLAVAGLLAVAALPLEAQFGGLKRRAQQAAERALKPGEAQAVAYNEHVLEMMPEVVDRLARALAAEVAERQEIARLAAAVRTPEAHEQCVMETMMSEEGQALTNDMTAKMQARVDKPGDKAAMEAHRLAQEAVMKHMRDRCGPDPDQFQSELRQLQMRPAKLGAEAGGFTATQYSILKERIAPLCAIAQTAEQDGGVRIPGDGKNIFWVYSEVEVQTIVPRCAELSGLIESAK